MNAFFLFIFETLARDLRVQRRELVHQALVLGMLVDQPLHLRRILLHVVEEFDVLLGEFFATVDLFLQIQRAWQPEFIETLQEHGNGADLLPALVFRGSTHETLSGNWNQGARNVA